MEMRSPVRIFPSGLTFTRSFGFPASAEDPFKAIISIPEIKYLPASDLQWILLLSSSIIETLKVHELDSIVK